MKSLVMIAVGGALTFGLWPAVAFADKDAPERCPVRVGHERPEGCAPLSPRALKPRQKVKLTTAPFGPPDEAWMHAIREPKNWASKQRSTRLLMQELVRLERLLRVTPTRSPERARMVRRLADGYAELEQLAMIERLRAELRLHAQKGSR